MTNQELADALKAAGIPYQLVGGKPSLIIDGVSAAAAAAAVPKVKKVKVVPASFSHPDDKELLTLLRDKKIDHVLEDSGAILVKGSIEYKGTKVKSLGSIREIEGSLILDSKTGITSLGALTKVGQSADLSGLPITSLDNLEEVGTGLNVGDCKLLADLGVLTKVGSRLNLTRCEALQTLGYNLMEVGTDLHLDGSGVHSLGSLTKVGEDLHGGEALADLGDLTFVGDSAVLNCPKLTSLGKLKHARKLIIGEASVGSLGNLERCDGITAGGWRNNDSGVVCPIFDLGKWKAKALAKKGRNQRDDDDEDDEKTHVGFEIKGWQFNGPIEDLCLIFAAVTAAISVEEATINTLRVPHQLIANISRAILEGRTKKGDTK